MFHSTTATTFHFPHCLGIIQLIAIQTRQSPEYFPVAIEIDTKKKEGEEQRKVREEMQEMIDQSFSFMVEF